MEDQSTQFLNPSHILSQINIEAGSYIGDLGCGTGYMSFAAARIIGEKGMVFAVDVQKSVLEQVKREAKLEGINNIETIWSDIESVGATRIAEQSLDVVLLVNTLFLVKDKNSVVLEAKRLIKQGGRLLVVEWLPGDSSIGPPSEKRVNLASIKEIVENQDFKYANEILAGKYHFGVIFVSN